MGNEGMVSVSSKEEDTVIAYSMRKNKSLTVRQKK